MLCTWNQYSIVYQLYLIKNISKKTINKNKNKKGKITQGVCQKIMIGAGKRWGCILSKVC